MAEPTDIADDAQMVAARAAGERSLQGSRAIAARYLPARNRIEIDLAP